MNLTHIGYQAGGEGWGQQERVLRKVPNRLTTLLSSASPFSSAVCWSYLHSNVL